MLFRSVSFHRPAGEHVSSSAECHQSGTGVLYFVHFGIGHRGFAPLKELKKRSIRSQTDDFDHSCGPSD